VVSSSNGQARVLIADRRPIAASGLAAVFAQTLDLVVRGCCHEIRQIPAVIGPGGTIDAVVIDAEMFDGEPRAVEALRALEPQVFVLLLTTRIDPPLLAALAHERVSCVSAFAEAYTIVSALRGLLSGRTVLPADVQRALMGRPREAPSSLSPPLTTREEQVLELAATGLTVCQIASRLNISHSTAKTHLLRVYEKLGARNRSAAVATAIARGVLQVPAGA
jgi:DNA-binding NarL/FixJ family response regulator